MHVAGTFPDNYIYGKCTYYIWEYGAIGENNTYLRTDHAPQVYIPCRIPCSSLVQYSLNCSLITRYSTTLNFKNPATSYQRYACVPALLLPQFCCYTNVDCGTYLALLFDGGRHDFFFSDPSCAACDGSGPLAGVSAGDLEDCPLPGAGCTTDCDVLVFTAASTGGFEHMESLQLEG